MPFLTHSAFLGFNQLVPERALRLCTGTDLEILVCGDPRIDIEALKRHTEYVGGWTNGEEDENIARFWQVLEAFSHEERSRFLRFCWGRSRLPRGERWPAKFRLTKKGNSVNDNDMPIGHTCFFQIELPVYSSIEVMRVRLTAAITFGLGEFLIA